jgi:hypothetical protein
MQSVQRTYSPDELLGEIMGFLPCSLVDELYDNMNHLFGNLLEGILERLSKLAPNRQQQLDQVSLKSTLTSIGHSLIQLLRLGAGLFWKVV